MGSGGALAGQILSDRYRVDEHIGEGGMSHVYRATDLITGEVVAIKMLAGEVANDETALSRFKVEAQAAGRVRHDNLVSVRHMGESHDSHYLVMDYVDGISLKDLVKQGPVSSLDAAQIVLGVADALHAIHTAGIVHRDVKPGNVMIGEDDVPKLTDFGIALMDEDLEITTEGLVVGTATYFSPEQAQGERGDTKSDLYSLGVLFYQLVAGDLPFKGKNAVAVATKHVQEAPPEFADELEVPTWVDATIRKLMSKQPQDRFDSALAVREHLAVGLEFPTDEVPVLEAVRFVEVAGDDFFLESPVVDPRPTQPLAPVVIDAAPAVAEVIDVTDAGADESVLLAPIRIANADVEVVEDGDTKFAFLKKFFVLLLFGMTGALGYLIGAPGETTTATASDQDPASPIVVAVTTTLPESRLLEPTFTTGNIDVLEADATTTTDTTVVSTSSTVQATSTTQQATTSSTVSTSTTYIPRWIITQLTEGEDVCIGVDVDEPLIEVIGGSLQLLGSQQESSSRFVAARLATAEIEVPNSYRNQRTLFARCGYDAKVSTAMNTAGALLFDDNSATVAISLGDGQSVITLTDESRVTITRRIQAESRFERAFILPELGTGKVATG